MDKKQIKESIEQYARKMAEHWGKDDKAEYDRWYKYFSKKTAYVVNINGMSLPIDKPTIKTSFCFGYGQNGLTTDEEMTRAYEMEDYASKNELYFIEENLKQLQVLNLKDYVDCIVENYKGICSVTQYHWAYYEQRCKDKDYIREMTDEEKAIYQIGLDYVREEFIQRLKTYLKRYGLSKLKTWTYLVD